MRVGRRLVAVAAVVGLLLAAAAVLLWSQLDDTRVEEAVDRLPADVLHATYTDWAAVQDMLRASDLTSDSSPKELDDFLDEAFHEDLTTASALRDSFEGLAANYGVTPLDAVWEVYGEAEEGSVDVLQLSGDVDLDALEEQFASMGYEPPDDGAGTGGVWHGTAELVGGLDVPLTSLQEHVAVLPSERLLLMSDASEYLAAVIGVIDGERESLGSVDGIPILLEAAGEPTVSMFWFDDVACSELAMSQADPVDVAEAEALVDEVGGVNPLDGLVMARQPGSKLTVGMVFASEEQASADLQPRTDLASGAAPGLGGTFSERFRIADAAADGRLVTMTLDPVSGPVLGDLAQGPVLFATC